MYYAYYALWIGMFKGFIFSGRFKGLVAMRLFHGAAIRVKMKLSRPKAKEITCKNDRCRSHRSRTNMKTVGENMSLDCHVTHTVFCMFYGVGIIYTYSNFNTVCSFK